MSRWSTGPPRAAVQAAVGLALVAAIVSGCVLPVSPMSCKEAAALGPAPDVPFHSAWEGSAQELAERFAGALGDPVVGGPTPMADDAQVWETASGRLTLVLQPRGGGDPRLSYLTASAWTPWDGSRMEQDARGFLAALGVGEPHAAEKGQTASAQGSPPDPLLTLTQTAGSLPTTSVLAVTLFQHASLPDGSGAGAVQAVNWGPPRDTSGLGPLLGASAAEDAAAAHVGCLTHNRGGVRSSDAVEPLLWEGPHLLRPVEVEYVNGCGEESSTTFFVDARTGARLDDFLDDGCE